MFKPLVRFIASHGLIELRRKQSILRNLGIHKSIIRSPMTITKLAEQATFCSYPLWHHIAKEFPPNWILIDIGANYGQFTSAVLQFIQPDRIMLFDPQRRCADYLKAHFSNDQRVTVFCAAVGKSSGVTDLHVTKSSKVASILKPDASISLHFPNGDFDVTGIEQTHMVSLDETVSKDVTVGLMKIDVQGFELEVLQGAVSILPRTIAVLMEINYVTHYVNQAGFNTLNTFLYDHGFRLQGVTKPACNRNGIPLWADAVYRRQL